MDPLNIKLLSGEIVHVNNPAPQEDGLSLITEAFIKSGLLNEQTTGYRLFFSGKQIKTNEELQKYVTVDKAGSKVDPIIALFRATSTAHLQPDSVEYIEAQPPEIMNVFQAQVGKYPNCIAATYGDKSLTYLELEAKSNQLATYLTKNYSVGPNIPIAIMGSNKLEMLISELAILKTGSAFVPFTPDMQRQD